MKASALVARLTATLVEVAQDRSDVIVPTAGLRQALARRSAQPQYGYMSRWRYPLFVGVVLVCGAGCKPDEPLSATSPSSVEAEDAATDTSTGVEPSEDLGPATVVPAQPADAIAIQDSLMVRWNAVADVSLSGYSFHWGTFDQFPHPTFKGGSAEAYRGFAEVLLAFFDRGDDFDFLAHNHLFTLSLVYVFPNGAKGFETTFQALAASFASADSYGGIPADTRNSLEAFLSRMQ